jgi:acyl-coenzyme A thioesterase PaaI-like protein
MGMDIEAVKIGFPQAVPMVGTLSLQFVDLDHQTATMRLDDQVPFHNHVGGPHAGAMFILGESASGALVLANFGDRMGDATPLAVQATIRYLKLAMGPVTATARMVRSGTEVIAELDGGGRPEFLVEIDIRDEAGVTTGEMTIVWTLKPHRNQKSAS